MGEGVTSGGSKCQWCRLGMVPLPLVCAVPCPPSGSFVKCLSELQVCICIYIFKGKCTAIFTYSASSLPGNFHSSLNMYTKDQRKAILCPEAGQVLQTCPRISSAQRTYVVVRSKSCLAFFSPQALCFVWYSGWTLLRNELKSMV